MGVAGDDVDLRLSRGRGGANGAGPGVCGAFGRLLAQAVGVLSGQLVQQAEGLVALGVGQRLYGQPHLACAFCQVGNAVASLGVGLRMKVHGDQ